MRGGAPFGRRVAPPRQSESAAGHAKFAMAAISGDAGDDRVAGFTVRTSLPTASTIPAASWPGMQGKGCG